MSWEVIGWFLVLASLSFALYETGITFAWWPPYHLWIFAGEGTATSAPVEAEEDDLPTNPSITLPPVEGLSGLGGTFEVYCDHDGDRVVVLLSGSKEDLLLKLSPDTADLLCKRIAHQAAVVRAEIAGIN